MSDDIKDGENMPNGEPEDTKARNTEENTASNDKSALFEDDFYATSSNTDTAGDDGAIDGLKMKIKEKKPKKKISVSTFIISSVALVLAAVMITFTCCFGIYQTKLAEAQMEAQDEKYYPFELFDLMLEQYALAEYDEAEMMEAALKAYVSATGDKYAEYYTQEEFDALNAESAGSSEGIGVNVINTTLEVNGTEYKVIRVINVSKDSPAEKSGVKIGDSIYAVGIGEDIQTVNELGYDAALKQLQGSKGTVAQFTVLRKTADGYEPVEFSIKRDSVTTTSVTYRKSTVGENVGIIKITSFDYTTPSQFCEAVDTLKEQGCDKFVFDVRYNPGGALISILAVLSYFLEEDDPIIYTSDKAGNTEVYVAEPVQYGNKAYAGCNVSKGDIGKYRGLDCVVLCNESTASAAELFTATFRDYKLADIVGTTTFGKGSMQTTYDLSYFGYSGAIKLTSAMYYPACRESYEGVGIAPDVEVKLSEEAASQNIYEIADGDDNQLVAAIEQLNK